MNIYATGSNVIFGQLGHLLIVLAFFAALTSSVSYYFSVKTPQKSDAVQWLKSGRLWFLVHMVSVIGVAGILMMMIQQHLFEYKYVWQHSSKALPFKFLLSAFWEGQEGSTMLWMFWHAIIGIVLMLRAKQWEAPVMAVVTMAQFLLGSMLLGIHVPMPDISLHFSPFDFSMVMGHYKMGSNPFALAKDVMNIPVFQMNPEYVFEDGNGLNPLLQNYWMVIHPPTLFLGFALCIVPFAYAFSSLWLRNYKDWLSPALVWGLLALAVLGTGILMGGAWAYEALSFGGFWAWDPVENASLVPWLTLAAGLHTLVAYRSSGHSLAATYVFFFLSFLLVLYSSFLTKSGVLGDSSVHSFTDMGMSAQLVICLLVFLIPAVILLIVRYKEIPAKAKEESVSSREFWMFIGSLVLLISALHIIIFTSFPVINKVFGSNIAPPDAGHYNSVEIWIAIMLGIGSAGGQLFAYKVSNWKKWAKEAGISLLVAIILAAPIIYFFKFYRIDYLLMAISASYAVVANVYYLVVRQKWQLLKAGGAITHAGFALLLIGILISQGRQHVVSLNKFGINYGDSFSDEENEENILLYQNEPQMMSGYRVTYISDSVATPNIHFNVLYEKLDESGKVTESFVLSPNVQINEKMGNVANPSTHKSLSKDLYTHITTAPLKEDGSAPDSMLVDVKKVAIGDTVFASRSFAIFEGINADATTDKIQKKPGDILIGAKLRLFTSDTSYIIEPKYFIRELMASSIPERIEENDVRFALTKIIPEENKVEITVEQKLRKYIIMKAIIFPYINLLWLGCFVMVAGILISMYRRYSEQKRLNAKAG
jgi:cytochrome c-type biogenesis protein CcmF